MAERTLVQLFEDSVKKYGDNIFMLEKKKDTYEGMTYREVSEFVYKFSAGLMSLGIQKGDRIALIAEGRNEWVISELGILYTGAISVPLSVKINEISDLKFRLSHSGCCMAVASRRQLHKILSIEKDLPELKKIIVLDPVEESNELILSLKKLYEFGEAYLAEHREKFENKWHDVKECNIANICYTSGTTADPKGIILTHRNYTTNVDQAASLLPIPEWYTSLLILPWDHSFAHTGGIYVMMKNGASISSIQVGESAMETLKNIPIDIKETKPVFLLSVPSLAKNFRKHIEKSIRQKGPIVEKLFNSGLKTAYSYNGFGWDRGKGLKIFLKPLYALYDNTF